MPTQWQKEYKGDDPEYEAYLGRLKTGQLHGYELDRLSRGREPSTGRKLRDEDWQRTELPDVLREAKGRKYNKALKWASKMEKKHGAPLRAGTSILAGLSAKESADLWAVVEQLEQGETPTLPGLSAEDSAELWALIEGQEGYAALVAEPLPPTLPGVAPTLPGVEPFQQFMGQAQQWAERLMPPPGLAPTPGQQGYTVQPGDTLGAIAARSVTSAEAIAQASGIPDPNLIFPGQQLTIPGGERGISPAKGRRPTPTTPFRPTGAPFEQWREPWQERAVPPTEGRPTGIRGRRPYAPMPAPPFEPTPAPLEQWRESWQERERIPPTPIAPRQPPSPPERELPMWGEIFGRVQSWLGGRQQAVAERPPEAVAEVPMKPTARPPVMGLVPELTPEQEATRLNLADILKSPWTHYLKPLFEGLYEMAKAPERGLFARGMAVEELAGQPGGLRISSFNDLVSTAMAMSGIPPLSEEEAKAEVVAMLETPSLTRSEELSYEDEVSQIRKSWELGEIGYSLMRFPERREDAWRMLEDGASMAEIMEKHEDLATEIVGNIIIDPVWFIPPAWAEKALPIGKALSLATKGFKKLPYMGRLIEVTKAGRVKTYGYAISDALDTFMGHMPTDESVGVWLGKLLMGDEGALATLGVHDRGLLLDAAATFKRGDHQWRVVITKYSREAIAGMPPDKKAAALVKIEDSLQAMAERIIQRTAPADLAEMEALLERDPRKIGRWLAEALINLKRRELGLKPIQARGALYRGMSFSAQLWKETILPLNIAFHQVNLLDSTVRMSLRGYFWDPGDLPVLNRILQKLTGRVPLEARVTAELTKLGVTLPRELQAGLIRELMDTEAYQLKTRYAMRRIPLPFIGKPRAVFDAFKGLTGNDLVMWAAEASTRGGLRGRIGKLIGAVRFEDASIPIAQAQEMGKGYEYLAWAMNRMNLASLVEAGAENLNIEPLVRITTFWKESEPLFNQARFAVADLIESTLLESNPGREAIVQEIADQIRNPNVVQSVGDLASLMDRYIADAGPKLDAFSLSFRHIRGNKTLEEVATLTRRVGRKPTTEGALDDIFAYGRNLAEENYSRVVSKVAPEQTTVEQLRLAGAPDRLPDEYIERSTQAQATIRRAYKRLGQAVKRIEGIRGSDLSFLDLGRSVNTRVQQEVWRPHYNWYNNEYWPAFQAKLDFAKSTGDPAEVTRLWTEFREEIGPRFVKVGEDTAALVDDITKQFLRDLPTDELIKALGVVPEERVAEVIAPEVAEEAPGLVDRILEQETERVIAEDASLLERATALRDDTLEALREMQEQAITKFRAAREAAEAVPETLVGLDELKLDAMRQMADGYEGAVVQGIETVHELFYDYAARKGIDELLWWASPFTIWQTRNPFGWAKAVAYRPAIVNVRRRVHTFTEAEREERALPGRFKGTVPIPDEITKPLIDRGIIPDGYYAADIRPFFSIWQQLPVLRGELPWGWEDEPLIGKIVRSGEFIGIRIYPWWQIPLEKLGAYGSVPAGDLTYISKYIRAITKAAGHEVDLEKPLREWRDRNDQGGIARYYGNLRLLDSYFNEEITMEQLVEVVSNPDNPLFGEALQEAADWHFKVGVVRGLETFTVKNASAAEARARLLQREYFNRPESEREAFREENPLLVAYWAVLRDPGEADASRVRQRRELHLELVRQVYATAIAKVRLGSKAYQEIIDNRRALLDQVRDLYPPYEEISPLLLSGLRYQASGFFDLNKGFFDEEGNIKDEYSWDQYYDAREAFLKELDWEVPGEPNLPGGRLEFERYVAKNEVPAEAILRAWERLYGQPVWDVISEQRDNENREQASRLIAEAKKAADQGRKDTQALIAELLRFHPDWTAEQLYEARKAGKKIATWNAWARRNQPLKDALWSVVWDGYMGLTAFDKKEFQAFLRDPEKGVPQAAEVFEKVMLPKDIAGVDRSAAWVSVPSLLLMADKLEKTQALVEEGFGRPITEVRGEIPPDVPTEVFRPVPEELSAAYDRYRQATDWYYNLPEEERPENFFDDPQVATLQDRFGEPSKKEWWTWWLDKIPPGPQGRSLLNDDPVVGFVLDKIARGEEDLVDTKHYQAASRRAEEFMGEHPELENFGSPEEYRAVTTVVGWIYDNARKAGVEGGDEFKDAVNQGWRAVKADPRLGPLIEKYYPPRTSGGRPPGMASPSRREPPFRPTTVPFEQWREPWQEREGQIKDFLQFVDFAGPEIGMELDVHWRYGTPISGAGLNYLQGLFERQPLEQESFTDWLEHLRLLWDARGLDYSEPPSRPGIPEPSWPQQPGMTLGM